MVCLVLFSLLLASQMVAGIDEAERTYFACIKGAQMEGKECYSNCRQMKEELILQGQCYSNCVVFQFMNYKECKGIQPNKDVVRRSLLTQGANFLSL